MSGSITVKAEKEKLNNAAKVSEVASLDDVILQRLVAINNLPYLSSEDKFSCEVRFMHRMVGFKIDEQNLLKVSVEARVEFLKNPDDVILDKPLPEDKLFALATVVYAASYMLPDDQIPEDIKEDCIPAFAELNGLYNCWPYLREKIQSVTSEMGIRYVLQTQRIVADKGPKEKKAKPSKTKAKPKPKVKAKPKKKR